MKKLLMMTLASGAFLQAHFPARLFAPQAQYHQAITKESFISLISSGYKDDIAALDPAQKTKMNGDITNIFKDRSTKLTLACQLSTENKAFNAFCASVLEPLKGSKNFTQETINSIIKKTLSEFKKQKNKNFAALKKILLENLKSKFNDIEKSVWGQLSKNNALIPALFLSSFMGRELTAAQVKNLEELMNDVRDSKGHELKKAQKKLQNAFKEIFQERAKSLPKRIKETKQALKIETDKLKVLEDQKCLESDPGFQAHQKEMNETKDHISSMKDLLTADESLVEDLENIDVRAQIFSMKEVVVSLEDFQMTSLVSSGKEIEQVNALDALFTWKEKEDKLVKDRKDNQEWLRKARDLPTFLKEQIPNLAVFNASLKTDNRGVAAAEYDANNPWGGAFDDFRNELILTNDLLHRNVMHDGTVIAILKRITLLSFVELNTLLGNAGAMTGLNHILTGTPNPLIKQYLVPLFENNLAKIVELKNPENIYKKNNAVYEQELSLIPIQDKVLASYLHYSNNQ